MTCDRALWQDCGSAEFLLSLCEIRELRRVEFQSKLHIPLISELRILVIDLVANVTKVLLYRCDRGLSASHKRVKNDLALKRIELDASTSACHHHRTTNKKRRPTTHKRTASAAAAHIRISRSI